MKQFAPFILIGLAATTLLLLLIGNDNYGRIAALRRTLEQQRVLNSKLIETVESAREEIYSLEHDKRALEKAARNDLGMARPGETIYLFDD